MVAALASVTKSSSPVESSVGHREPATSFLTVEIANGVQVKVQRHTVASVLPKGTLKSA
jgi:preprotein translocase subunit YajC